MSFQLTDERPDKGAHHVTLFEAHLPMMQFVPPAPHPVRAQIRALLPTDQPFDSD